MPALVSVAVVLGAASPSLVAQSWLPRECPQEGTFEIVDSPSAFADLCFLAVSTRLPNPTHIGETDSQRRDIDLDGNDELLEIRGTGNSIKQIYVFEKNAGSYLYKGRLDAHPSFVVELDAAGIPTLRYVYRMGADNLSLMSIQYIDNRYRAIASEPWSPPSE